MGQSIIEINGKKYDATTGRPVEVPQKKPASVDGVIAHKASTATPKLSSVHNRVANHQYQSHDVHKPRTKDSSTLMRHIVKKPGTHHTPAKPITNHNLPKKSPVILSPSYATSANAESRLDRALSTPPSQAISRFNPSISGVTPGKLEPSIQPLAVQQQTTITPPIQTAPPLAQLQPKSASEKFVNSQLAKVASDEPQSPFKKAPLHRRVAHKIKSNKLRTVAGGTLALLLLTGFVVYQNLPRINLAMANREAGINAKLPDNVPSNFEIDRKINSSGNLVVLNFKSRVDDRSFTVTQAKTNTTAQSLESVVEELSEGQYQTYQTNGLTLFISDGTRRVDWVDGDMQYNILGETGLTTDQLAQIATSL